MDIQRLNSNIKWQQLTAKEILKYQQEGEQVPNEYQQWAAAISAALEVNDDVTYEMVNGETDIATLNETFGRDVVRSDIQPADQTENNIGNESEETRDEAELTALSEENAAFTAETPVPPATAEEQDALTLANQAITTDPNEILKRKQRLGIPPLS